MPCCQVGFRSHELNIGDWVWIIVVFPQNGLGLQTGWEQAASTWSACLWLATTTVPSTVLWAPRQRTTDSITFCISCAWYGSLPPSWWPWCYRNHSGRTEEKLWRIGITFCKAEMLLFISGMSTPLLLCNTCDFLNKLFWNLGLFFFFLFKH